MGWTLPNTGMGRGGAGRGEVFAISDCLVIIVINYVTIFSLSVSRIPLNQACGTRDICLDVYSGCNLFGYCKCISNYFEKNTMCGKYYLVIDITSNEIFDVKVESTCSIIVKEDNYSVV